MQHQRPNVLRRRFPNLGEGKSHSNSFTPGAQITRVKSEKRYPVPAAIKDIKNQNIQARGILSFDLEFDQNSIDAALINILEKRLVRWVVFFLTDEDQ
uniref:Uncharacterized protein n=1 Tax=Romanomermis culicivorax TaxID=13658 RepID=A0A915IP55_ROMCU